MAELPVCLYRAPVSPGALVVLTRLWAYASSGRRWVHPKVETLQADLGLPTSTCYRRLKELQDKGLIERECRIPKDGKIEMQGWRLIEAEDPAEVSEMGIEEPDEVSEMGIAEASDSQEWESGEGVSFPNAGSGPPNPGNPHLIGISHLISHLTPHPLPAADATAPRPVSASGVIEPDLPPTLEQLRAEVDAIDRLVDATAELDEQPAVGTWPLRPSLVVGPRQESRALQVEVLAVRQGARMAAKRDTPSDAPGFALTAPGSDAPSVRPTAEARREAKAAGLWERYEALRVEQLRAKPRRAKPDSDKRAKAHRSIVRLVRHVREVEDLDEPRAWERVEAYARGSIAEAASSSGEWGDRMRRWRADWQEWRTSRFDQWAASAVAGPGRGGPSGRGGWRGPIDPATQDHDAEVPF